MSTDGDRPQKAAQTEVSSDTRCLEDIPIPSGQSDEGEKVEVDHIVRSRDLRDGEVLPLVCDHPDAMVYVKVQS